MYLLEQHVYVLGLHLRMLVLPLCGSWPILSMFGFCAVVMENFSLAHELSNKGRLPLLVMFFLYSLTTTSIFKMCNGNIPGMHKFVHGPHGTMLGTHKL